MQITNFYLNLFFQWNSERMSASQCLAHPWLKPRSKSVTESSDEQTEKKLPTKKLRRFVIRRRWQVNDNILYLFCILNFLLASSQCFTSIATYGTNLMNTYDTIRFNSSL